MTADETSECLFHIDFYVCESHPNVIYNGSYVYTQTRFCIALFSLSGVYVSWLHVVFYAGSLFVCIYISLHISHKPILKTPVPITVTYTRSIYVTARVDYVANLNENNTIKT